MIKRLKELQQRLPHMHFVMHGSSSVPQEWLEVINAHGGEIPQTYGVPVAEIVEGIKYGVRKVNIDTDLRMASTGAMRRFLAQPEHVRNWMPAKLMPRRATQCRLCAANVTKPSAVPATPARSNRCRSAQWRSVTEPKPAGSMQRRQNSDNRTVPGHADR